MLSALRKYRPHLHPSWRSTDPVPSPLAARTRCVASVADMLHGATRSTTNALSVRVRRKRR
eukprot:3867084-Rhodomonas_salina.2